MSVQLDPSSQLGFQRPLTQVVKKSLIVRNNHAQPVAFKVKTTAPKLYCVRPNSGRMEPGQSVEVSVILQPMKEDPPPGAKCKDKFLVQSTFITPDKENLTLADIWAGADSDQVHQQKIKVVYLPVGGEIPEEVEEDRSLDPSRFQPSHYETVRPSPGPSNGHTNVLDTFVPIHRTEPRQPSPAGFERSPSPAQGEYIIAHEDTTQHETHYAEPQQPGVVNINVHSPAPPAPQPVVDDGRLAEAQDEISRLKALVGSLTAINQQSQMRRRTKALSDDGSFNGESIADDETVIDRTVGSESGVPLQVVIIIALAVFVTTYLFF